MRIDVETPFFDGCRRFDKSDLLDMYPDKEGFISLMLMLIKETDALKRRVDILKEVEKEFKSLKRAVNSLNEHYYTYPEEFGM